MWDFYLQFTESETCITLNLSKQHHYEEDTVSFASEHFIILPKRTTTSCLAVCPLVSHSVLSVPRSLFLVLMKPTVFPHAVTKWDTRPGDFSSGNRFFILSIKSNTLIEWFLPSSHRPQQQSQFSSFKTKKPFWQSIVPLHRSQCVNGAINFCATLPIYQNKDSCTLRIIFWFKSRYCQNNRVKPGQFYMQIMSLPHEIPSANTVSNNTASIRFNVTSS